MSGPVHLILKLTSFPQSKSQLDSTFLSNGCTIPEPLGFHTAKAWRVKLDVQRSFLLSMRRSDFFPILCKKLLKLRLLPQKSILRIALQLG